MRKWTALFLLAVMALCLAACQQGDRGHSALTDGNSASETGDEESSAPASDSFQVNSNILIAYDPAQQPVVQTAEILADTISGDLLEVEHDDSLQADAYEYVLLGFAPDGDALPQTIEAFLQRHDFGARTIYPFVQGDGNEDVVSQADPYSAISQLQPGALMGGDVLMITPDTTEDTISAWAESLGINSTDDTVPENSAANTVATATVTPEKQQVLYLWEEGNAPAQTEYTVNNGGYSDDPDFRPYITSFPVPEGIEIKGAVLICPGGAFQFRSDQPEGVDVAEALSALGYQSFVVDYRLRPYTQQEGALDLARAVRFVRSHAEEYGIDPGDIAVMGFSAGGILSGEMLLNFDGNVSPTTLDPQYQPDALDGVSADAAACGMIYSFYGRLSVGTTDVELLRSGDLPPTFYCYGTRDPFYEQFLANADAAEKAGVEVERLQLDGMPHGFGASGDWIPGYDQWLGDVFAEN